MVGRASLSLAFCRTSEAVAAGEGRVEESAGGRDEFLACASVEALSSPLLMWARLPLS